MKFKFILPMLLVPSSLIMIPMVSCGGDQGQSTANFDGHQEIKVDFKGNVVGDGQAIVPSIETTKASTNAIAAITKCELATDKKSATVFVDLIREDDTPVQKGDEVQYAVKIVCNDSTNTELWTAKSDSKTIKCTTNNGTQLKDETEWKSAWSYITTPSTNRNVEALILCPSDYTKNVYKSSMVGITSYYDAGAELSSHIYSYLYSDNVIWTINKTDTTKSVATRFEYASEAACMSLNHNSLYKLSDFNFNTTTSCYEHSVSTDEKIYIKFNSDKKVSFIQHIVQADPLHSISYQNDVIKFSYGTAKINAFPSGDAHTCVVNNFTFDQASNSLIGQAQSTSSLWIANLSTFETFSETKNTTLTTGQYELDEFSSVWNGNKKLVLGTDYTLEDESGSYYKTIKINSGVLDSTKSLTFLPIDAGTTSLSTYSVTISQ